ncbi:MAG: carboxypeptidase regulatory-like domain-containing protein [Longimicrobiales bacterium]
MSTSIPSRLALWVTGMAGAALFMSAGHTAGQESGRVVGSIFDSVSAAPLQGAEVYLWNTSFQTSTDTNGEFELLGVPPGSNQLVFLHDLLLELGVSTGNREVDVEAGGEVRVELATPSPFTILRTTCLLEASEPESAVVVGQVGDDGSGIPLSGAKVHLTWHDELGSPNTIEALTDSRGWFRFCAAPVGVRLGATSRFLTRTSARQEMLLSPEAAEWVEFQVADLEEGTLTGNLIDQDRGWGVEDAEVSLLGTRFATTSGSGGGFRFTSVPPGQYTLSVKHLAYGERTEEVSIGSAMAVTVALNVSVDPIELDPIEVTVESIVDMDGIVAGGTLISREDVDRVRHRATDLADIIRLQHMKGMVVRRGTGGELCVGTTTGQVRLFKKECSSAIFYLDNARVGSPDAIVNLPPAAIDRIVVYRPVEAGNLFGLGSGNGVVVVYTRGGRGNRN